MTKHRNNRIFQVIRPRAKPQDSANTFFHSSAVYTAEDRNFLESLIQRLKTHLYSCYEEIATDIESLLEYSRYSHKRCSNLNDPGRLVYVCSCVARKLSPKPKPIDDNSTAEGNSFNTLKKSKIYSRYHGQKERRWNLSGCKYRLIFYKEDNGYRLFYRSILYHNHPPATSSRKEFNNQLKNIKIPLSVINFMIKTLTELYVEDELITSDVGRFIRDKIKQGSKKENDSIYLNALSKKLFYLIIRKVLVQFSSIFKKGLTETWDVYIYLLSFFQKRAANYLRHDSIIVLEEKLPLMKKMKDPENPKSNFL